MAKLKAATNLTISGNMVNNSHSHSSPSLGCTCGMPNLMTACPAHGMAYKGNTWGPWGQAPQPQAPVVAQCSKCGAPTQQGVDPCAMCLFSQYPNPFLGGGVIPVRNGTNVEFIGPETEAEPEEQAGPRKMLEIEVDPATGEVTEREVEI